MDDLFEKYDEDGDGFVSPVEIENQLHVGIITVNYYVATYDEDNDGTLNEDGE